MIRVYQGKKIEVKDIPSGGVLMTYGDYSILSDECNERVADKLLKLALSSSLSSSLSSPDSTQTLGANATKGDA